MHATESTERKPRRVKGSYVPVAEVCGVFDLIGERCHLLGVFTDSAFAELDESTLLNIASFSERVFRAVVYSNNEVEIISYDGQPV